MAHALADVFVITADLVWGTQDPAHSQTLRVWLMSGELPKHSRNWIERGPKDQAG